MEATIIKSADGFVFKRIHDGFLFGNEIWLGVDYSTGVAREDKAEYYEEVEEEIKININNNTTTYL